MTADRTRTVVVGFDGSDAARAALALACEHAGSGGRVFVVHAYHLPSDLLGFENYDDLLAARQRHGRAVLDDVQAAGDGPQLESELVGGSPAEAIDRVARARDADEIVVGARGLSPARAVLGSVTSELLHHADRPVVVVPAAAVAAKR